MLRTFASVSRLHIVAIGAMGTLTFGWLFSGERPYALALLSALDWFIVNLLNRVVDIPEDRANQIHGTSFVEAHRRALLGLGFGVLFASFVVVAIFLPELLPYRIAFHVLGLAYNWPVLPGRRRIKQLYFFKNTASATGFMLTVFCYPLAHAKVIVSSSSIVLAALFFFLFELSYEVIYDLRDREGDAQEGVRSYAVVHGEKGAAKIADGLILGSCGILIAGYATGVLPWRVFIMIAAPALQLILYKRALLRGITSKFCIGLTWLGAALLAVYHLWIAAGLPGVA